VQLTPELNKWHTIKIAQLASDILSQSIVLSPLTKANVTFTNFGQIYNYAYKALFGRALALGNLIS